MELKKGQNMLEHEAEIFSRPARTWFQTEKEKARAAGDTLSWLRLTHELTGGTRHVIGKRQGGNGIVPGESGISPDDPLKVRPKAAQSCLLTWTSTAEEEQIRRSLQKSKTS